MIINALSVALYTVSFALGVYSYKDQKCESKYIKLDSHIVETSDFIPSYERDWREFYS